MSTIVLYNIYTLIKHLNLFILKILLKKTIFKKYSE